jgi:predicted phosphodiesterase
MVGAIVVIVAVSAGVYVYLSQGKAGGSQRETQVWWIASDPHVGYYRENALLPLQVGIEDVNEYIEKIEGLNVDHAILLGDLIHETHIYVGKFLRAMENLNVESWYYVLGNHDYNQNPSNKSENKWTENLLPEVDMTLDVMGMKWILISDHAGDTYNSPQEYNDGTMPENVREWFLNQVLSSDKPVFVFSHQPPVGWKVWTEDLQDRIYGTELRAWFYGHIHNWSGYWFENQVLIFSDCSLDWAQNYKGVFMFLDREGNDVNVTLKFRDHENHAWIKIPFQGENIENISFSVKVA